MALSQNVVINFLTKFDRKGLQRATKELKGFDKVIASSKFATKAALVTAGIGAAFAFDRLARSSIRAALEQEKLDKSVEQSLSSINKLGSLSSVKTFVKDLQTATNITKDQLTPALNGLIISTGNLSKAQNLLGLAIDISQGSGTDLLQITDALAKANRGNFKALGQLGLGFDAVTAKEIGLADITDYLTLKFGGAAQRATATFGAKLDDLKISAGEAQKNLGEGFITAGEIILFSSDATDVFGAKLEQLGLNGGFVLVSIADKIDKIRDAFVSLGRTADKDPILSKIFTFESIPVLPGLLDGISKIFGTLAKDGKKITETTKKTVEQTAEQKEAAAKVAVLQAKLDKFASTALNKQKALTKSKKEQMALDAKKSALEAMFDKDRINLQAALNRGGLSGQDQLKVQILQQLADGTADAVSEAEKYADILKVIEDGQITSEEVAMLAGKWGMTTANTLLYLQKLFLANTELTKMLALYKQINDEAKKLTAYDPLSSFRVNPKDLPKTPYDPLSGLRPTPEDLDSIGLASGGIVTRPTRAIIGEAGAEAVIPLDRLGSMGSQTVNVNVSGSVISQGQLETVIQDILYKLNRSGSVTQLASLGR